MTTGTRDYLTCAETAKLVRRALRDTFPGVTFRVRSKTYSGGASIDVSWTDGPTGAAVDKVLGRFSGADFDGMVDLKTYRQSWLNPDGTATVAYAGAQGSTHPEYIGDPPHPNARLVRFGADFVHGHRAISDAWTTKLLHEIGEFAGVPAAELTHSRHLPVSSYLDRDTGGVLLARDNHRGEYATTLVWQLAAGRDRSKPCQHGTGTYPAGAGVHRCKGCGLRTATAKPTPGE